MNKNILTFSLLGLILLLAITAVTRLDRTDQVAAVSGSEETETLTILSTFTVISDMVREVGGERVEAISLTKPGTEIHGYEPTPGDLVRASKADAIFDNGLDLESWAGKLYASVPNVPHYTLTDGIELIPIASGDYEGRPNPHAWMSPKQALVYVDNIRDALSELDPDSADYFAAEAERFKVEIEALDDRLANALAELPPNHRALVTCEGAFSYLAADYNLTEVYLWAINDESQGTPQQIKRVVDTVRAQNIPTVFCESTIEPRIQEEVARAAGARLGGLLFVDSLSEADGPAPTYLSLLEHTVNVILEGLQTKN